MSNKVYIKNLVSHLIRKNHYEEVFRRIADSGEFIKHIKTDLEFGDVRSVTPAKLGEIMCAFEDGDVLATKEELFANVHFYGDCRELLRELVSLCLAYKIKNVLPRLG